jgi:F-type H+-transporting ATPase subunit b
LAFLFLLRFLFSRNLNVALNRLNVLHEENLMKEAQLTEELKRAKEEKDAEITRGKTEAASIVEEARSEGAKLRQKIEDEAKRQAEKIILQSREELERLKQKMQGELQNQSFDLAVTLIAQVFTEQNKESLQQQFINEIIEEIAKLPQEKFTVSTHTVKVTSSYALQEAQRDNLKKILNEKLGSPAVLEEKVDGVLICGLSLELGGLIIDGTLKNKLRRAIQYLKKSP